MRKGSEATVRAGGERAILIHRAGVCCAGGGNPAEDEFLALAQAAGAQVVGQVYNRRLRPDPRFFLGSGKVDEIAVQVVASRAELVLVDESLSPAQERNLERVLHARVLDRTGLILDIFARRARSFEGRIAVERAQLKHLSTRLVRGWTHLERQKGGIGLRGPGETQLEVDRRLIGRRIRRLEGRLETVERRRAGGRMLRRRNGIPVFALVGYTNAGKTTLFNRLTQANAYAANQLFATLDPLLRRIDMPGIGDVILADTVGFVSELPHELIDAFKATLSEAREADLLIHVIDAADPESVEHVGVVNRVLAEIGCAHTPQIEAYNKIDRVNGTPGWRPGSREHPPRAYLSAMSGIGIDTLLRRMGEACGLSSQAIRLELDPTAGRFRARLFALDAVVDEVPRPEGGWTMQVRMREASLESLRRHFAPKCARRIDVDVY